MHMVCAHAPIIIKVWWWKNLAFPSESSKSANFFHLQIKPVLQSVALLKMVLFSKQQKHYLYINTQMTNYDTMIL